jgi:carbon-monoxide dehydrogenase large subunit
VAPLAGSVARYVGDPVAIVVADSRAEAEDAVEFVEVDYEPLPAVVGMETALADEVLVHPERGTNVVGRSQSRRVGDVEEALASCPHVFAETLRQHRHVASPMEGRAIIARWDAVSGELTVRLSSQGAHAAREGIAATMGVDLHRVRVIVADVGGAFGQKIRTGREEHAVCLAARAVGSPVRWTEDRWENLVGATHSRDERAHVRVGTDDEGRIIAIAVDQFEDVGAYGGFLAGIQDRIITGGYRIPHAAVSAAAVNSNTMSRCAYRGPWMLETLVRETMVDIVARGLGMDPLEVRRRNVLHADDLPYTTPGGAIYDVVTPSETLEQAVAMLNYDAFRVEQAAARTQGRYLGVGISVYVEPSAGAFGLMGHEGTVLRIDQTGKVHVTTSASSQGHSIETTLAQVVADELGVPVDDVVIMWGDTATAPPGGPTGGSRNAVIASGSAMRAAGEVRTKVLAVAAHLLEAAPEDLEVAEGVISVKGTPRASKTVAEVAHVAYNDPSRLPPGMAPGLDVAVRWQTDAPSTYSNATHICTCEVDPATGVVRLLRYIVSEDCGVMINPNVVEGQIAGGVVQGIGGVLFEHLVYDQHGNPLTTTFLDYLLPTSTEIPEIEYGHIETRSGRPGGFKGMGEGGAIGAPAAVINAVADAIAPFGVNVVNQPLGPQQVLALITPESNTTPLNEG